MLPQTPSSSEPKKPHHKCGAAIVKTETCPTCGQAVGKYGALIDVIDVGKEFLVMVKNILVHEDRLQVRVKQARTLAASAPPPPPTALPRAPLPAPKPAPPPPTPQLLAMTEAMRSAARRLRQDEMEGRGD